MPPGLTEDLAEHGCGRGLGARGREKQNCKAQKQAVCAASINGCLPVTDAHPVCGPEKDCRFILA